MLARILKAALAACVLGLPRSAAAQTSVTFDVPVNLTQVPPDLEKIKVTCFLSGSGLITPNPASPLMREQEVYVMAGQLVITIRVMFPLPAELIPPDPVGKQVDYGCGLFGFSKSLQKWGLFAEAASDAAFRLKPTPQPITGSFVW